MRTKEERHEDRQRKERLKGLSKERLIELSKERVQERRQERQGK